MSKLDDIIRKVEGLIAKAEGTENNHEADAFRTKAEAMMLQYRIEESQVGKGGQASVSEALPQWEDIVVCSSTSSFRWSYVDLLITVARHMDVRHELANQVDNETGGMNVVAQCVGYESDLRFLRVLWSSIRLAFQDKLEPKVDPSLSMEENAYRLRAAGTEGIKMAYLLFEGDTSKSNRIKARKAARKFAVSIGENPDAFSGQGNSMKLYRESYSQGFKGTIRSRLRTMSNAREPGTHGGIVLASRKDNIDEAYYERFPNRRPKPAIENASVSSWDEQKECPKCQKAKSGYCREHGWMRPSTARVKTRYANMDALRAGQGAARNVDLGYKNRSVES